MIDSIYNKINDNSAYYNIIYDKNKIGFSINDDRISRVISILLEYKDSKYIAYGIEKSQIKELNYGFNNKNRTDIKIIVSIEDFWKWFSSFYNDMH